MISMIYRVRKGVILLALAIGCQGAWAGAPDDYAAGLKAYDAGDLVGAMPLLRRAADAGHAPAQALLAYVYDYSEFDEDAVTYYRKAADQGHADGQFGLGSMLSVGKGAKKDLVEARRLITLAAEQGHKPAINVLALAYLSGQLAIGENERQSEDGLRWIKRAADNDYLPAIDALIQAYRSGGLGLGVDVAAANRLQAKANELRAIKPASVKGKGKGKSKEVKK
jgi:hypothetical protein